MSDGARLPVVVLISGGGPNLQALIDAAQRGLPFTLRAVVSNRADAFGLERARRAGIPTETLDHRQFRSREDFDRALMGLIDRYDPELVLLAGFMRILTPAFVDHYRGRLLNIHPSLLPQFQGLHTHRRALQAGVKEHGASVHFVTEELDGGPVIVQARIAVLPGDTEESLAARVLEREHLIYPLAVRWFAEGRLQLDDHRVRLDGRLLETPADLDRLEAITT